MPDISRIRLVLSQDEDETFEIKDSELRDDLNTLLGVEKESSEEQ